MENSMNLFWPILFLVGIILGALAFHIFNVKKWANTGARIADTADNNTNKLSGITNKVADSLDNTTNKLSENITKAFLLSLSKDPADWEDNAKKLEDFALNVANYMSHKEADDNILKNVLDKLDKVIEIQESKK